MTHSVEVRTHDDGAITQVVLGRPADGNAFDQEMAEAFAQVVETAAADGTRVLLLTAAGKLFCAGGDVRAMSTAADPGAYTAALAASLSRTMVRIAESDMVFVCGVQGAAAGAGFSLLLNADYVVASKRVSLTAAYLSLGVTPDVGASYLLPRAVGRLRASEVLLGGRRLDAATALDWGLISEVVAPDDVEPRAITVSRAIAASPAPAASATKRLLAEHWLAGYRDHLDHETALIAELIASPESRERQAAFLNR